MGSICRSIKFYIELIMSDYKAIKGKPVLNIASDLDNAEGEGEIWFNTASSDYKTIQKVAGSWSTGGALNTGRQSHSQASYATRDTAFVFAGPSAQVNAETYDGSSWTEVGNINTGRQGGAGAGIQTTAILATG